MKKPNITEGEWEINKDSLPIDEAPEYTEVPFWSIHQKDDGRGLGLRVCEIDWIEGDDEKMNANAQAISAVPEMIDMLIECHKAISSLPDKSLGIGGDGSGEGHTRWYIKHELLENIEQALKKSGVEL